MKASAALLVLVLAGCTATLPPKPEPPVLDCADQCFEACDTEVPAWSPPDPSKPEAWDFIRPQVIEPLKAKADQCERRRAACARCIDDAVGIGILRR